MTYKIKLKKGDLVMVRTGKYKGKTGKITATHPKTNQVSVDGLNIVKKHLKPNKTYPQGTILSLHKPLDVSKVAIIEPTSKKPSRLGYKVIGGKKLRVFKKTGKEAK